MRLDEKDHEIFRCLRADARTPMARIGQQVGLSADAVRGRISRLSDGGVLRLIGVVDPGSLGLHALGTVGLDFQGDLPAFVERLRKLDFVTFVALTLGEHNVICEIAAADDAQLLELATSVVAADDGVRRLEMWRLVEVLKWHGQGRPEVRTSADQRRHHDELDAELLRLLARDPRLTYRQLGDVLGQPYSLVRRRTQQLFDEGSIQASAVLDRSSVAAGTTGLLGLPLTGRGIAEALDFAVRHPDIAIVARTLGRFAATLEVVCETPRALVAIADRVSQFPAVTGVSTYLYARSPVLPVPWQFRRIGEQ
jgi:DNA-binding Lrp family transcriptional regulator